MVPTLDLCVYHRGSHGLPSTLFQRQEYAILLCDLQFAKEYKISIGPVELQCCTILTVAFAKNEYTDRIRVAP